MISLTISTVSIQAIYLAFNIACRNFNTLLKCPLTLRRHCYSGPRYVHGFDFMCQKRPDVQKHTDGAHGIGVQNVTSNCNVATLNSFFSSPYI